MLKLVGLGLTCVLALARAEVTRLQTHLSFLQNSANVCVCVQRLVHTDTIVGKNTLLFLYLDV